MSYDAVPDSIKSQRAWLVWKRGPKKANGKFDKFPFYADGTARKGKQGSNEDKARLVTFAEAINALPKKKGGGGGVGLAMLPELELVVLDCDNVVDPETKKIAPWAQDLCAGTYTEYSPSGKGLRAIFFGKMADAKNHEQGLEVFCEKGFVTITGDLVNGASDVIELNQSRITEISTLLGKKRGPGRPKGSTNKAKSRYLPLEKIRVALTFLDPDDREVWLKVAWALGRECEKSDAGFEIYTEWASKSKKYSAKGSKEQMRKEYFEKSTEDRDNPVTIGTIFHLATLAGWKDGPFTLDEFFAFLPLHKYFYIPTREFWDGASINSIIEPWPILDGKIMQPTVWLDKLKGMSQMTWHPAWPDVIEGKLTFVGGWKEKTNAKIVNTYNHPPEILSGDASRAKLWRDHLHRIFPGEADEMEFWLAHRIQRPGEKINHALVIGGVQGIGKDSTMEPIKRAVGNWNWAEIGPTDMFGDFNSWVKSVVVRVSEIRDMGEVDRYKFYEHAKSYITSPPDVVKCNEKYIPAYYVFNVAGFIFTTNHKTNGIYLPRDDRRHFVAWSEELKESFSPDYWDKYWGWLNSGTGVRDITEYLRGIDLSGFNPNAPPRQTDAWWAIVQSGASQEDVEVINTLSKMGNPAAVTLRQVIANAMAHDEQGLAEILQDRRARTRIPHILERAGYTQIRNSDAEKTGGYWTMKSGKQSAIYAKKDLPAQDRLAAALALSKADIGEF